jgi:hypothetical protein
MGKKIYELLTGSSDGHCLLGDHFLTLAKRDVVEVFVHGSKTCRGRFNKTLQSQKLRHLAKLAFGRSFQPELVDV